MVVKVGLKPTYNLLLLRNIVYRMIHFKKQFHILQLIPSDLLLTLSAPYVDTRLDASSIFTIKLNSRLLREALRWTHLNSTRLWLRYHSCPHIEVC